MVRGFRLVVSGVCTRVGECRYARSIVAVYLVAVGERHGSAVYALSRRDDRCDLFLAGVIHAGCFHGNDQLRRFDLDGHSSGRGRVFLIALRRGECPFGIIAACIGLDCAVCPCKCAVDGCTGVGVFHRAVDREFTVSQRLTIGNLACADSIALSQNGNEFVLQTDMDGQRERLIVRGFDLDVHRANFITLIGACGLVDGQAQIAVSDGCAADGIVIGDHEDARLTILDIAVLAALRKDLIQNLIQIDLVGLCQIVENGLIKLGVTLVDGGLIDLEGLILQLRAVQRKVLLGRAVVKDIARIL